MWDRLGEMQWFLDELENNSTNGIENYPTTTTTVYYNLVNYYQYNPAILTPEGIYALLLKNVVYDDGKWKKKDKSKVKCCGCRSQGTIPIGCFNNESEEEIRNNTLLILRMEDNKEHADYYYVYSFTLIVSAYNSLNGDDSGHGFLFKQVESSEMHQVELYLIMLILGSIIILFTTGGFFEKPVGWKKESRYNEIWDHTH